MSGLPSSRTPFPSTRHQRILNQSPFRNARKQIKRPTKEGATFKDFTKKTWITYACSPLYRFKQDKDSLKRYSKLLSAVIIAKGNKRMGIGTESEEVGSKAVFSLAPGIAVNEDEPESVKISIFTKEEKLIAEMYLTSACADPLLIQLSDVASSSLPGMKGTIAQHFTALPLLLCKGLVTPRNIVFEWLMTEFDCSLSKMEFNSHSLAWMLGLWAALSPNESKRLSTKITWKIPVVGIGLDTIETEFDPDSIDTLWKAAHDPSSSIVEWQEIENFLGGIEEHLTQHFRIKFKALALHELKLEIGLFHSEGKIKMFSQDFIPIMLLHFTELAIARMHWKSPKDD